MVGFDLTIINQYIYTISHIHMKNNNIIFYIYLYSVILIILKENGKKKT